jgi:hypothetical protein
MYREIIELHINRHRHLGSKTTPSGAILVGHVPHVAPEAWLHELFPGLDNDRIERLESLLGTGIPDEYRAFLHELNGVHLYSSNIWLGGDRTSYTRTGEDVWHPFSLTDCNGDSPQSAKSSRFFIGGIASDGQRMYLGTKDGSVHLCSQRSTKSKRRWPNIVDMLSTRMEELSHLYNESGKKVSV